MAQHASADSALLPKIPGKGRVRTVLVIRCLRLYFGGRLLKADRFQKRGDGCFVSLCVCEDQRIYHFAVTTCGVEHRNPFFAVLLKWCESADHLPVLFIVRRKHLRLSLIHISEPTRLLSIS